MATACLGDRAPCLPSRTWWISSRTNSPACVEGDLPSRASSRALSSVSFSGMVPSSVVPFLLPRGGGRRLLIPDLQLIHNLLYVGNGCRYLFRLGAAGFGIHRS